MIAATLLLLLFLPVASVHASECPASHLICYGSVTSSIQTTEPAAAQDCDHLNSHARESIDHPAGRASAEALSVSGLWAFSNLEDDYVLAGPPAGTALTITARWDLDLQNIRDPDQIPTWVRGILFVPPVPGAPIPNTAEWYFRAAAPGTETQTHELRFALPVKVGTPFYLSAEVGVFASGRQGGYSRGRLSFEGLPPLASVTSCKGFRQDTPVPALPLSWGAVKATYR